MEDVYQKLLRSFERLPRYIENICYHTFIRIHTNMNF